MCKPSKIILKFNEFLFLESLYVSINDFIISGSNVLSINILNLLFSSSYSHN